jgi:hypothetical protein
LPIVSDYTLLALLEITAHPEARIKTPSLALGGIAGDQLPATDQLPLAINSRLPPAAIPVIDNKEKWPACIDLDAETQKI